MDTYSIDQLPCAAFAVSDSGYLAACNTALCDMVGVAAGELDGAPVTRLLTTASGIFYDTHVFPLLKLNGRVDEVYFNLRRADGTSRPVLVCATRLAAGDGGRSCFACMPFTEHEKYEATLHAARRASEAALAEGLALKDAQDALRAQALAYDRDLTRLDQRNAELAQVTRMLFHDLAEPLRKIRVFADMLADGIPAPDAPNRLRSAAAHMDSLLHTIELYVSIGRDALRIDAVAVEPLLREALERARRAHPDVRCEARFSAFPVIEADPFLLAHLFEQIFDNALKFHMAERSLLLSIEGTFMERNLLRSAPESYRYGDVLRVRISDNGRGFDPAHGAGLFKLAGKLDRDSDGAGCGLAICRKIVTLHFGTIDITARPDEGAQVTVELPLLHLAPPVPTASP